MNLVDLESENNFIGDYNTHTIYNLIFNNVIKIMNKTRRTETEKVLFLPWLFLPSINNKIYRVYIQCYWILYTILIIDYEEFINICSKINNINENTQFTDDITSHFNVYDIYLFYIYCFLNIFKKIDITFINHNYNNTIHEIKDEKRFKNIFDEQTYCKKIYIFIMAISSNIENIYNLKNKLSQTPPSTPLSLSVKIPINSLEQILESEIFHKKNSNNIDSIKDNILTNTYLAMYNINDEDLENFFIPEIKEKLNNDKNFLNNRIFLLDSCFFFGDIYCYKCKSFINCLKLYSCMSTNNINNIITSDIYFNTLINLKNTNIENNNHIMIFLYYCSIGQLYYASQIFIYLTQDELEYILLYLDYNVLITILKTFNYYGYKYNYKIYYKKLNSLLYQNDYLDNLYKKKMNMYFEKNIDLYHYEFFKKLQYKLNGININYLNIDNNNNNKYYKLFTDDDIKITNYNTHINILIKKYMQNKHKIDSHIKIILHNFFILYIKINDCLITFEKIIDYYNKIKYEKHIGKVSLMELKILYNCHLQRIINN